MDPLLKLELKNSKKLERALRKLDVKIRKKITRDALRPAAKIIQQKAKANAPRGKTGELRKAIKVRALKRSRVNTGIQVRLDWGSKGAKSAAATKGRRLPYYAGFQELGYRIGSRKLGNKRTLVPGKHFMENAFKSEGPRARDLAIKLMWQGIERAAQAAA